MLRKASGHGARRDIEGSKALHIRAAATVLEFFHEFDEAGGLPSGFVCVCLFSAAEGGTSIAN